MVYGVQCAIDGIGSFCLALVQIHPGFTLFPTPLLTGGANSVQIEDWVERKVGSRVQSMADKARDRLRKQTAFDEESVRSKVNDLGSDASSEK